MHMARRVQILHPEPLILMSQRDAVIPIIRNPDLIHHGAVDRSHVGRFFFVAVAKGREAVCVFDVWKGGARVVGVEGGHEGKGVVVDYFFRVRGGEGFEGSFESVVCRRDDDAEGGPLRGGVDA